MSMNVKRFIIKIQAVVAAAFGLLGLAAPSHAETAKVTMAPGQIVVKAAPGMSEADIRALAAQAKCDFLRAIPYNPGYYVVRLTSYAGKVLPAEEEVTDEVKTAVAALQAQAGVAATPNVMRKKMRDNGAKAQGKVSRAPAPPSGLNITPDDPIYPQQWGLNLIRMPEAWAIQVGTKPILAGVADTGIDLNHDDFKTPDGAGSRIAASANFVADGQATAQDGDGHGTHVAGTVSATTNNAKGVASVSGWNRGGVDVKLVIARVLDNTGSGTFDAEIAGIGYLIDQKVNVINLSLGGTSTSDAEKAVIQRAIDAKIVVVAALGNDGVDTGTTPFYPASLPGVISVTAVGRDKQRAFYSNYGGNATIAAPGGSDPSFADQSLQIWSTFPTNTYQTEQGTSMASPHVAGAVALLLAAGAPQDPVAITKILQENAQPLTSDVNLGAGLLDVYSSLLPYSDPQFTVSIDGAQDRGAFYSSQVSPIRITAVGVTKAPPSGAVKVVVYQLPNSPAVTFVEGKDFTIPRTIPDGQPKATPFNVQVPANGQVNLSPGRYKAVLTVNDVPQDEQFFDVIGRTQSRGKTLFAYPFRVRDVSSSTPEQTALGFSTTFTLARYNTLRNQPSSGDYFLWQTDGVKERGASFSAIAGTNADGSEIPFVTEAANPGVNIAPVGLGYWLDLTDAVTVNTVGTPVTTPVYVKLYAANGGWNMVGAPFTGPSSWGTMSVERTGVVYGLDEAIRRGYIASALIGYANGDYVFSIYPYGEMQPFQGYWVKAYVDCTLIIAPTSLSRKAAAPVRRGLPPVDGWRARLSARVAGDSDGQNYFGQARGAKDDADANDVLKPPSGGGHSYLRFVADKDDSRTANAFDMRSLDSARSEWTAAVSADRTNADVTITWDNLASAPRRAGFTLTDTVTGKKVDMRSRSSYTFRSGDAGSTRYLKVTMTPGTSAGPLAITGMSVVGGRSASDAGFTVRFATTAEADISGVIKSLNGKAVADLAGATRATAGTANALRWDGRARSGGKLPPGPYLVEVTARAADGQTAKFVQPIQNLR